MNRRSVVLVVDDELRSQEALRRTLEEEMEVLCASGADEARALLAREFVDVILADQRMPGTTGVDFLRHARESWPEVARIIISAYADTEDIIAGINEAGIYQYILKPWQPDAVMLAVRNAAELRRLARENHLLNLELRASGPVLRRSVEAKRDSARRQSGFERLARAAGSPIDGLCDTVGRVARYDIPILVTGESGTGKELLARAVHYASPRSGHAFVVANCAALPDTLLESELFGHKRGSFTGAYEDHVGLFQQAEGGTLFLDEIGETTPLFQVKLLRALQDGEIRPIGAGRPGRVDVRVIAATNRDLDADVRTGRFREDLYYRLAGLTLRMPSLRERPADIPVIAQRVLQEAMAALGKEVGGFTAEAVACMRAYPWPGNVRELQNEIHRMLALGDGDRLGVDLLAPNVRQAAQSGNGAAASDPGDASLRNLVQTLEAQVLEETLARHRGNKSRAAHELGLSRVGLRAKLARYGLEHKAS